jgi:hypothetical protein
MIKDCYDNINRELHTSIAATEAGIQFLADQALRTTIISVNVSECDHPLLRLDPELSGALHKFEVMPIELTSVDLQLEYEQARSKFDLTTASLNFDTGNSLVLYKVDTPYFKRFSNPGEEFYLPFFKKPDGKLVDEVSATEYLSKTSVQRILSAAGILLSDEEQPADMRSLETIFHFARKWTALTTRYIPIDDVNTVLIADKIDGRRLNDSEQFSTEELMNRPMDGMQSREITFCVDVAELPGLAPLRTVKIETSATNRLDRPKLHGIWHVPLEFKPYLPDDGIGNIAGIPVRHEIGSQAALLALDAVYLDNARATIADALGKF